MTAVAKTGCVKCKVSVRPHDLKKKPCLSTFSIRIKFRLWKLPPPHQKKPERPIALCRILKRCFIGAPSSLRSCCWCIQFSLLRGLPPLYCLLFSITRSSIASPPTTTPPGLPGLLAGGLAAGFLKNAQPCGCVCVYVCVCVCMCVCVCAGRGEGGWGRERQAVWPPGARAWRRRNLAVWSF